MNYLTKSISLLLFCTFNLIAGFDFNWLTDLKGDNTGHTTCQFLTLPHSATLLATGQASSGGAMDATDIPVFIANTAGSDRDKISVTHLEWFMGLRKEYLGGVFPIMDVGAIGVYSQMFTPGTIGHARTIEEEPSSPSMIEYSLGATFASQFFNKKLSVGAGISYLESRLDKTAARSYSGSVDILATPFDFVSGHLYVSNVSPGISYGTISEYLPAEAGISLQFRPLSKSFVTRSHTDLTAGIGVRKITDQPVTGGISTEIKFWNLFSIKSGYEHSYGSKMGFEGFGAGAGLQFGKYGIDGAWRYESKDLGSVWAATLKMQFEEILPKTAEEYYVIALKHYKKKRFGLCEYYAKKAIALDPNMWKAHSLLSKSQSDILRDKNLEIGIIYIGNEKGAFVEPIDAGVLGGLARQATIIKSLQTQFPLALTVESGNLLSSTSDPAKNNIAGLFFDRMNFDVVAAGNEEIDLGLEKLQKELCLAHPPKFLCKNSLQEQSLIVHQQRIEKNGYLFFITSIINEALVNKNSQDKLQKMLETELTPSDVQKYNLRILVLHDKWNNIVKNAHLLENFDVVICSSIDQSFQTPMKIGQSLILSAGANGEYVGNLILRFNNDKQFISAENKLYAVSDEIIPDSAIARKIDQIAAKIDFTDSNDTDKNNMSTGDNDGAFPFISDRNGIEQVFLKVTTRNAEFPISAKTITAKDPVISFSTGKIAYREQTDTGSILLTSNLNGTARRIASRDLNIKNISILPDGKWIYFAALIPGQKKADIYRQRIEGGPYFSLIHSDSSNESDIAFSSTDNLMAFCSEQNGYYQINLSDQTGVNPLKITDEKADHFNPLFSPDGQMIAYLSDRSNFGGKLDLWFYDRHQKQHHQLTHHSNVKEFCWTPDSRNIIFSSGINTYDIYKVGVGNYRFSKLINRDSVKTFSERSPVIIHYRKDVKIAYTREYEDGMRKIYWVNEDGTGDQCLVNSSKSDWLPNYRK